MIEQSLPDQLTLIGLILLLGALAPAVSAAPHAQLYAELRSETVLDNDRVIVDRFIVEPGQSTGRHTPHARQLLVFVRGGVLKSRVTGRSVLWRDGAVAWRTAEGPADDGETNAGSAPIELLSITLKPHGTVKGPGPGTEDYHLNYPNIPGEDLLENDEFVVQRFLVQPGQWEGIHEHRPGMLYVHIRGGQWATRSKREPEHTYPRRSPDGGVGWMEPVALDVGHESGNVGLTPIDLVWVTLKH